MMMMRFVVVNAKKVARNNRRILCNYGIGIDGAAYQNVRMFSNNDAFRDALKKAKANTDSSTTTEATEQSKEEKTNDNAEATTNSNTESTANNSSTKSSSFFNKFSSFTNNIDTKELPKQVFDSAKTVYFSAIDNFKEGWNDMLGKNKKSVLQKKVMQAESFRKPKAASENDDDDEEEEEVVNTGPSAIVLVQQPKSAWEQMKNRLQDSPFIKEMLKNSQKMGKVAADTPIGQQAQKISQGIKDKIEDAKEIWETSQNPLIYTVSGIWDNITGDTEESMCVREIRKLDPDFVKEEWAEEVRLNLVPDIIKFHLLGETKKLKPWLGEAVYNKLAADIRARKSDGITFDTNILDIEEHQIVLRHLADRGNISCIVAVYLVQQINCVRNKAGEIIEGGESEVRAKIYSIAFQQNYNEETGEVGWKIIDYEFGGDQPYI
jgi:import inner membrane translocase subunit TIM44